MTSSEKNLGKEPSSDDTLQNSPTRDSVNGSGNMVSVLEPVDHLHRRLGNRQVQLIAIGGSIGTALFVSIGSGLHKGGPGSLFLAYFIYCCFLACINNCMAEMAVMMPVTSGFIRMAGHWVDEAFGFMSGWNFFLYEAVLIPFEITALSSVLTFWTTEIPVAAVCAFCIICYSTLNLLAVKYYGEAEFWLAGGKLILIMIVFMFTFITMVGGNPLHDPYGFRYWNNPGSFATFVTTGSLGRFEGFLGALWSAAFTIVGPEYVAMVAGECQRPRVILKNAFKTMYWRFAVFFIGGALCVGIVIPYNDPKLVAILTGESSGAGTAAASPYVIAMQNLGVSVLPHITNALLITSIFSAGNSYVYCGTRSLYGLAIAGQAPKILRTCTKHGVPVYCFAITICFAFLSFLQVSNSTATVLSWFVNLLTGAGIINYFVISMTYLFFYRATQAQNLQRKLLPYYGYLQPFCGWVGLCGATFVVCVYGYTVFIPGLWDTGSFLSYYLMCFVDPVLYIGWKLLKKTKVIPAAEADLVWEKPQIDAYEAAFDTDVEGLFTEIGQLFGFRKKRNTFIDVPAEEAKAGK